MAQRPSFQELLQAALAQGNIGQDITTAGEGLRSGLELGQAFKERERRAAKEAEDLNLRKATFLQEVEKIKAGTIQPGDVPEITRPVTPEVAQMLVPGKFKKPSKPIVRIDPLTGLPVSIDLETGEVTNLQLPSQAAQGAGVKGLNPKQFQVIDVESKKVVKDEIVNLSRNTLSQLQNARTLLNSTSEAAPGPFRSISARVIAGEKGVLTEQDVARNTGSQALADKFKRLTTLAATGRFTEKDKKDFNILLDEIETATNKKLDSAVNQYVDRTFTRLGGAVPKDQIKNLIYQPAVTPEQSPSALPVVGETFQGGKVLKIERVK